MKTIKSYVLVMGALVVAAGSLTAKAPLIIQDFSIALDDIKNDQDKVRKNAQGKVWGQALWHAQDSTTARKTLENRLFEPVAADYGKADDKHKEVYKHLADYMKTADAVFAQESDVLSRLASEDILTYKVYRMDKRLSDLKSAITTMEKEEHSKLASDIVNKYKLSDLFSADFLNHLTTTKKAFVADAKNVLKALEKEVAVLRVELKNQKAADKGKLMEEWYDALDTDAL